MEFLRLLLFTSLLCACCGWRPWLVLAALGVATQVGWFVNYLEWSERFSLLDGIATISLFFGLYLVEFGIDKSPGAERILRQFGRWARAAAAAFVAFLALFPANIVAGIVGALAGGVMAWTVTKCSLTLREKRITPRPLLRRVGFSLGEDVLCWLVLWIAFAQLT
ncbi:MAG: DUF4126 domain-containing protein [Verrucomicrobiota bacterium]